MPRGVLVNHATSAKIRQAGWFTVDPAKNGLVGTAFKTLGPSKGFDTANDNGDRTCKDLFRYDGQASIPPGCSGQPVWDGNNFATVEVERLAENHIKTRPKATS